MLDSDLWLRRQLWQQLWKGPGAVSVYWSIPIPLACAGLSPIISTDFEGPSLCILSISILLGVLLILVDEIGSCRKHYLGLLRFSVTKSRSRIEKIAVKTSEGVEIRFAHTSFKWSNLASHNAGVTVAIIGIGHVSKRAKSLWQEEGDGGTIRRQGSSITPSLTFGDLVIVKKSRHPLSDLSEMEFGNKPSDGGHLLLEQGELVIPQVGWKGRLRNVRPRFPFS
jgi:hypothetical protein